MTRSETEAFTRRWRLVTIDQTSVARSTSREEEEERRDDKVPFTTVVVSRSMSLTFSILILFELFLRYFPLGSWKRFYDKLGFWRAEKLFAN